MKMSKRKALSKADQKYLEFVEKTAKEVAKWPPWMRLESTNKLKKSKPRKKSKRRGL